MKNNNKKIAALAFADLHANDWKISYSKNNNGLKTSLEPLRIIGKRAKELNVPVLFAGDLIHKPKVIDNEVLMELASYLKAYFYGVTFLAISGNHDQSKKNTSESTSPSYIRSLDILLRDSPNITFRCIDNTTDDFPFGIGKRGLSVAGIPYYTHNNGFDKVLSKLKKHDPEYGDSLRILLIHRDLPGATNAFGHEIGESNKIENLRKYFKPFDLVLCGHIHKPQRLAGNVIMMGSPYQQNSGDMGLEMGYWEIYDDGTAKMVPLDLPKFKPLPKGMEPPDDYHYYVPQANKANKASIVTGEFNNKVSRASIAKSYIKAKKIKSKSKKKALIKVFTES